MNKLLLVLLLALLLALSLPQMALAMGLTQEIPSFELPDPFVVAFGGFLTFVITEALKRFFPKLAGIGTQLAAVVVAGIVVLVTGVVNAYVPSTFFGMFTQLFLYLATLLTAYGLKRVELNFRKALHP